MKAAGYDDKFALGTAMSAGTLGIVIPPSIPMIVYGLVTEASITDLFLAGVGPGILILIVMSLYSMYICRNMPTQRFEYSELNIALREGIWAMVMPVILLGGIYSGYFTATEAAAVALVYACIIVMILNLEIGFLTPPVGLNLTVAMSAFKQPFGLLVRAAVPYVFLLIGCLAVVIWQPWIAMALVNYKR